MNIIQRMQTVMAMMSPSALIRIWSPMLVAKLEMIDEAAAINTSNIQKMGLRFRYPKNVFWSFIILFSLTLKGIPVASTLNDACTIPFKFNGLSFEARYFAGWRHRRDNGI